MFKLQKEAILTFVKASDISKDFSSRYLLLYKDFFDTGDDFTEFNCERMEGKASYVTLIEQLVSNDQYAQVFAEVYGFEEEGDDIWIYADTLIVLSGLCIEDIRQIFEQPTDIFPSEIGYIEGFTEKNTVILEDGTRHSMDELCNREYNYYYCWWD